MTSFAETALRVVAIGVGATAVMDGWLLVLNRLGIPTQNFALLGRWMGHWPQGLWFHDGIARATPVRAEAITGWSAHYAIGIGFAAILVALNGANWMSRPSLLPALTIGIATVAAPLFVMQPALGLGIASSRTARPMRNVLKSVANHIIFGIGLYVSGAAIAALA